MNILLLNRQRQRIPWILNDEFSDNRASGEINGTIATDGHSVRTVIDTENKLSQSGGLSVFAGGKASPAFADPGRWWPAVARAPGRILIESLQWSVFGVGLRAGWGATNSGAASAHAINVNAGQILGPVSMGALALNTAYKTAIVLRATGAFYFVKGGAYASWTLLWIEAAGNTASLYPAITNYNAALTADLARVPPAVNLWLPAPLASDGFSAWGTTDGAGHAEGVAGGIGAGGSGKTWTARLGAWGVAAGKAQASALDGTANIAVATLDAGTANALIGCALTRSAGNIGLVFRYTDAQNYAYCYHDGTNQTIRQVVAGVDSQVTAPAAATYAAGGRYVVICDGTAVRAIYNAANVMTGTLNAALIGTQCGLYTSDTGNTFDNFVVTPRGTGNEHVALDQWLQS